MKKIYLLLFALIATLSAQAAAYMVVGEKNSSNNHYIIINNGDNAVNMSTASDSDKNFYYRTTTKINNFKLTYEPGTVGDKWCTPDNFVNAQYNFTCYYYNGDNTFGATYELVPKLHGDWSGNNNWSDMELYWDSARSIYYTNTQTKQSSNQIEFGMKLVAGNTQRLWMGFNTTFNAGSTSDKFSSATNSKLGMTYGYKYHFEFDPSTMTLKVVDDNASITLTTSEATNVTSTSATLNYSFTATGLTGNYTIEYRRGTSGSWTSAGTKSSTGSGTINISGLTPNTTYSDYYIRVSNGSTDDSALVPSFKTLENASITVTTTDATDVTTTTATLNYSFTSTGSLTGDYSIGYRRGTTGSWISAGTKSSTGSGTISISGLTPNTTYSDYYIRVSNGSTEGTALVPSFKTADDTKTAPRVTITPKYNSNSDYPYYIATITGYEDGSTVFYTTDGTNPNSADANVRKYNTSSDTPGFQVSPGMTIQAYYITKDNKTSALSNVESVDGSSLTFDFETPDGGYQLNKFRINIVTEYRVTETSKNNVLTAVLEDHTGNADYGDDEHSIYSWAKYADYDAFEQVKATNPNAELFADHCESKADGEEGSVSAVESTTSLDVQRNNTDTHVARCYTMSYYRVYVQSKNAPTYKDPSMNQQNVRARVAEGEQEDPSQPWKVDDWTVTAGNVDPDATSRIAYTVAINPLDVNTPTGVEDIVAPEAGSEFDTDAPVYYYNLQGVQVVNPEHGIYIRVQGKKATKIYVK